MLNTLSQLNKDQYKTEMDPEIESRIAQYEMAYRMQSSVPDVTDLSSKNRRKYSIYTVRTPYARHLCC